MAEYLNIPVEVAKRIAVEYAKQQVVIIAVDHPHNQFHTVTYGVSAADKVEAAKMGEFLTKQAGGDTSKAVFSEDFRRDFDAAKYKQARELLQAALDHGLGGHDWMQTRHSIEFFLNPPPQPIGCSRDTDGDGNCHIHPDGCPK